MGCTSELVGESCDGTSQQTWHIAMYGPGAADPRDVSTAIDDVYRPPALEAGGAAMWLDFGPTVDLSSRPDVGSYLVRTVPEPSVGMVFAVSLIAFAAWQFAKSLRLSEHPEVCN